jgi:nitrate reductase assembly molybdenum cofactor insertion protein NarJ
MVGSEVSEVASSAGGAVVVDDGDVVERARQFMLASLASAYPGEELGAVLATPAGRDHAALAAMARTAEVDLAALQRRYIDLFDRGKDRVSLYETEHGRMRGLSKGHDLADLSGFYRAFGLALDSDGQHELYDHVAVELEFYAVLLLKQHLVAEAGDAEGGEIVRGARRAFLADHLGRFVAVIAAQPAVHADAAYGAALAWCAELVDAECARLGVAPAPLDYFAAGREPDEVECGGKVKLPVVD